MGKKNTCVYVVAAWKNQLLRGLSKGGSSLTGIRQDFSFIRRSF